MQKKWQHNPVWNGDLSWGNIIFLVTTPPLALALMIWQISARGFSWVDFAIFFLMMKLTGMSITAGYHRLFSHQTYETTLLVKFFFLFFGAGAFQNSVYKWASDHRYHHRFADKEGDPYNINRGFFYAHMGWIFFQDPKERCYENAKDLFEDPLIAWQHKNYLWISVLSGFLLPTLLGWFFGRPLEGFIWGGLFRAVYVHHGTFFINSLAHTLGNRPYCRKNSARDNWWLAFMTNGEGYHNFHHAFGSDFRNGLRWYQWDPTKWLILMLNYFGLAQNLKRTPEATILKAKLEASIEQFQNRWQKEMPDPLEKMRLQLEGKLAEFQLKLREFNTWKEAKAQERARWKRTRANHWRRRLNSERLALETSINEFRALLAMTERYGTAPFFT